MQLRGRASGFIRTEGGLLPADLLERVRALDRKLPGLDEASYGLAKNERFGDAIARSWNRLVGAWATFTDELANEAPSDPATTTTRERFVLPLFEELGYGRLSPTKAIELDGKSYPVSHAFETVPLHLVGANIPLDRRSKGVAGAAGQSPHGLVQELLNRSPERLWGLVTNGRTLRILRDNASLVRQAYVEFDLEAIMVGEAYADFALLWHLAHRTRLEPRIADGAEEGSVPTQAGCYLERWSKVAEETGARARDRLRDGVQEAIEALGSGFLYHRDNTKLRTALETDELTTQDYYRELLRLVYRFILLFVAEDRDLLLDPKAEPAIRDRYARFYSTARLRRLAERRKGSRHADLYAGLRVVVTALGSDDGAPGIGLPPLGGFLFGPEACPHLDPVELANGDLLDAIRKLATIEERNVLRTVDYRNLGSEELGSIYESLLELHPEIDTAAGAFKLTTAAGHERKTTGSYYTPSSLISVLLDSALDPVLAEAADKPTKEEAERAILELSVVDPAAGSGHFLVAAAHRIAKRLAQVRTEDEEPAPSAITTALRDVIGHCLYAVDINPMAVELCKVSLWLEALEPGKPLTFLDAHIKCGNSLLGTTPELIAAGIPDAAYDPIEGDDKVVAAALKKRNRQERDGQLSTTEAALSLPTATLERDAGELESLPDHSADDLVKKAFRYDAFLESTEYRRSRAALDAWCAAFVSAKVSSASGISTSVVRLLASGREPDSAELMEIINESATAYGLFHWPLEFPAVFGRGGFDVAIGNPPWERVKLQEKEFFAERNPAIASARNSAERKRMIDELERTDPALRIALRDALRRSDGESRLIRKTGAYPLSGRGDINTYAVFAELMRAAINGRGRQGVIVPTGIATDDTTKDFFKDIVDKRALVCLFSFENERFVFPSIHHATKFCILVLAGSPREEDADLFFFARDTTELGDPSRHFELSSEDFKLFNPNSATCPTFRTRADAELSRTIYRRFPVFVDETQPLGNPWAVEVQTKLFDMADDSPIFADTSGIDLAPLFEAKMVHQYDHRFGTYVGQSHAQAALGGLPPTTEAQKVDPHYSNTPRYWVPAEEVGRRLEDRSSRAWLVGWRDVTSSVSARTIVAAVLPRAGVGHTLRLLHSGNQVFPIMVGNLNSFALDWHARQKAGGIHLTWGVLQQLPVLAPASYHQTVAWADVAFGDIVRRYVAELAYTSWNLQGFAEDLGWYGPPFVFNEERRALLRAELDAMFFHAYGLARGAVGHVLDSFWIVRERDEQAFGMYRTKELVLIAYDSIGSATRAAPWVSQLLPVPGAPEAAHPPGARQLPGTWTPFGEILERDPASSGVRARTLPHRKTDLATGSSRSAPLPRTERAQTTLTQLLTETDESSGWHPEDSVDSNGMHLGARVRHRSFGEGTILAVRHRDPHTTLRVRFAGEEREISLGYGVLEFEAGSTT